jgi:hypothetical protein
MKKYAGLLPASFLAVRNDEKGTVRNNGSHIQKVVKWADKRIAKTKEVVKERNNVHPNI